MSVSTRPLLPFLPGALMLVLLLLPALGLGPASLLTGLEQGIYDLRVRLAAPEQPDSRVVIADIDEKSLAELGQWPWGRLRLAELVETLFGHYQIAALGFDVVFAEKDQSSGMALLDWLARGELRQDPAFQGIYSRLRPTLDGDHRLADALEGRPAILGYYFRHNAPSAAGNISGVLPEPVVTLDEVGELALATATGYTGNLPEFQEKAFSAGFFDVGRSADGDGVFRRVPLLQRHGNGYYQSLPLGVLRAILGNPPVLLGFGGERGGHGPRPLEWVGVGRHRIPVDGEGNVLIPFRGGQGSFPYAPVADILAKRVDGERLKGAVVLLGASAPGLLDLRNTPVQALYPGVEIHANLIAGVLDDTIKQLPAQPVPWRLLLMLVAALPLLILSFRLSGRMLALLTLLILATLTAVDLVAWFELGLALPSAAALLATVAMFLVQTVVIHGLGDEGKHRSLQQLFAPHLPAATVRTLHHRLGECAIAAERREMTMLCVELADFTPLADTLSPAALTECLDTYLTPVTGIIHGHGGGVAGYQGSGVTAFWGAPLPNEHHARHAMAAALELQALLEELKDIFQAKGWPTPRLAIALNSGLMTVGELGSRPRPTYAVVGAAAQAACQLKELSFAYGVSLIAGESTRELLVEEFLFQELDRVQLKEGKGHMTIHEPLGRKERVSPQRLAEAELFQQALGFYRIQLWDEAERLLRAMRERYPGSPLARLFLSRIQVLRHLPPPMDWDGVFPFFGK